MSNALVPSNGGLPTLPGDSSITSYLDSIAPASISGRIVKFDGKRNGYVTSDDGKVLASELEFIALCDQTLVGWVKFNKDTAPTKVMGLLYAGFKMPSREEMGDNDPRAWQPGLDNKPQDPWQHQIYMVLQETKNAELFTFITSSATGRRAIGSLLRHFERMRRTHPGELPVIKLKVGGYDHKDSRIGWVPTPAFVPVGRAPYDSVAVPDTSPSADLEDEIPF